MKHTEGPWSYDKDENEVHSDVMADMGGDPFHICEMMSNKIEDATLVAAAPEMYEASELALNCLENLPAKCTAERFAIAKLKDAIKKAHGG